MGPAGALRPSGSRRLVAATAGSKESGRLSQAYLLLGSITLVCFITVPALAGSVLPLPLVGVSIAIAIGVNRYRPRPMLPWVLFVLAQVIFISGDLF